MWGLGKPRTKLGKWLDRNGYDQVDLEKASGVSKNTITKACNDKRYFPRRDVLQKLMKALKKIDPNLKSSDFWDM